MTANIEVAFVDGESSVVAFEQDAIGKAEQVLCAWAVLWRRGVTKWEPTDKPAAFYYDVAREEIRGCGNGYRDELSLILPHAREVAEKFDIPFPSRDKCKTK